MSSVTTRLTGDEAVLEWLRPALQQAGHAILDSTGPTPDLWIHAGPAASALPIPSGTGVLVAPEPGAAELELVRAGAVEVVLASTPREWILARIDAVRRRVSHLAEVTGELRRFEDLIGHLSDGVAVVDATGTLVMLNAAGAAILGWPEETRGRNLLKLAVPLDDLSAGRMAAAMGQIRVHDVDVRVRVQDGRRVVLAISSGHLRRAQGRAILSFRDVTEQRRNGDFLEHLVEGSSDAIVASNMRGRLVVFNRTAERLFGISSAEARRKLSVIDLYPRGGAREMMRLLREAPTGRVEAVRLYCQTRTGELVPIEISASLIRVNGEEVATVGLLRDLRERVRVETELARTRSRLVEAEKQSAVAALAGATAHELNQPLTVVLGYVDLLQRKVDPSHSKALDAIAQQGERMAEIVRRISQLTHIETQSYPGERQIADLEKSSERKPAAPVVRR